jgi:DNA polymerase-3 subunit gamma/tau
VLCTTEPHKVMPTIVDRCQRFDFQRPSLAQIAEVIRRVAAAEQIEIADGAVAAIARGATGSFRDALGTLDQLVSYGGKRLETDDVLAVLGVAEAEVILAAAEAIASQDGRAAFEAAEGLAGSGRDPSQFGRDLLAHLRQLLVIRTVGEVPDAFSVTAAEPERLHAQAGAFTDLALARAIDSIAAALAAIREGDEARMTMELALLRAARPQLDPSREALAQRLERLERALEGGIAPDPHRPRTGEDRTADAVKPSPDDGGSDPESSDPEPRDPSTEALDLERLTTVWPALVDQLRESGSEVLSHVLSAARPVAVDMEGAVLKVGFPAGAAFNKRKAEAAEARDRLADAVRTLVGERLRPVFVLLEGEEYEGAAPGEPSLSEDELLEHLMTEFDAEELADAEPGGDQEEAA